MHILVRPGRAPAQPASPLDGNPLSSSSRRATPFLSPIQPRALESPAPSFSSPPMARDPTPPPPPSAGRRGRRPPSSPVANPAPTPSLADQSRHMSDEATRQLRRWTRALRSGNTLLAEAAMLAAAAYSLGSAVLDLCPWCKKAVDKVVEPPFCPRCHRDLLADDPEYSPSSSSSSSSPIPYPSFLTGFQFDLCCRLHKDWEAQWKSIKESDMTQKNHKELELLRKTSEKRVDNKSKIKKAMSRE